MTPFAAFFTRVASIGTVAVDIAIVVFVAVLFIKKRVPIEFVARFALWIGFASALGSLFGSLFYSNYVGFVPCTLCWAQRIFMYPLVLMFAIALLKKDRGVVDYALWLSGLGAVVAAYHSYIQFGGTPVLPCSADVISCSQRFFVEFGFVTIPTMSLTAFLVIFLAMLAIKKSLPYWTKMNITYSQTTNYRKLNDV